MTDDYKTYVLYWFQAGKFNLHILTFYPVASSGGATLGESADDPVQPLESNSSWWTSSREATDDIFRGGGATVWADAALVRTDEETRWSLLDCCVLLLVSSASRDPPSFLPRLDLAKLSSSGLRVETVGEGGGGLTSA